MNLTDHQIKNTFPLDLDNVSEVLRLLSNPCRLKIVLALSKKAEYTASDLAKIADLNPSAASQHLSQLKNRNIVSCRREKQYLYYSLKEKNIKYLLDAIEEYSSIK